MKVELSSILPAQLLTKSDGGTQEVSSSTLAGKTVGIYFSAHWCPPCRNFTPFLAKTYQSLKSQGTAFEIVFVSMDKDQGAFDDYYSSMPWMAVKFSDSSFKSALSQKFSVNGIPCLVMIDEHGEVICTNARSAVMRDPAASKYPWAGEEEPRNYMPVIILAIVAIYWLWTTFFTPSAVRTSETDSFLGDEF